MESNKPSEATRVSTFVLVIIFLVLAVSFSAIVLAVQAYSVYGNDFVAAYLMLIGILGVALSIYVLTQTRRRLTHLKIEPPPVVTTIECRKCGFKNVRKFQRGDYVFKEVEPCEKCNENMMITAIYREVHEKKREGIPF
ncbi:hypothetical protein H5T51_04045 [Candidatus Bathyarchaeota archaeon]|nr:hypothetical protein [Candidatus Bathyarchaeota archaeon]